MINFMTTLLTISSIVILGFCFYMLYLLKTKSFKLIIKQIGILVWTTFGVISIILISLIIASLRLVNDNNLELINLISYFFQAFLMLIILKEIRFLISQLKNDIIFDRENVKRTLNIGKSFIIITSIEIISGMVIGFISFSGSLNKHYGLTLSLPAFVYLLIGFMMIIVSIIYDKSIDIYEENTLTI